MRWMELADLKRKADAWDQLREWLRSGRAPESTYLVMSKMADLLEEQR